MKSVFELGREATHPEAAQVGYRPDGSVLMAVGREIPPCAEPRCIHFHPARDEADPAERLRELRRLGLPIHGLSPGWISRHDLLPVDSLALYTGGLSGGPLAAAEGWQACLELGVPYLATVTYASADSEDLLLERLELLTGAQSVLLLPRGPGDRLLRDGSTTDGIQDTRFLALARRHLPARVRVRASWAALGWKMAQATLAFGTDELAGWGLEEQLAYGKKGSAAAIVGAAEVRAGIEEAGRVPVEM